MNKRIRELAKQASDYANTYSDVGADVWFEIYNKKFAELIVKECSEIARLNTRVDSKLCVMIQEHFGVTE
jgi:hypothetical protein